MGPRKFAINKFLINSLSFLNILQTIVFVALFISFFQFWTIEEMIFSSEYLRIIHVIRLFVFINLLSSIFTSYSVNTKSRVAISLSLSLQKLVLYSSVAFIIWTYGIFRNNYRGMISDANQLKVGVSDYINQRFLGSSFSEKEVLYGDEMEEVILLTEILILFGFSFTLFSHIFTNFIYSSPLEEEKGGKKVPKIKDYKTAAMDSKSLEKIKIVDEIPTS